MRSDPSRCRPAAAGRLSAAPPESGARWHRWASASAPEQWPAPSPQTPERQKLPGLTFELSERGRRRPEPSAALTAVQRPLSMPLKKPRQAAALPYSSRSFGAEPNSARAQPQQPYPVGALRAAAGLYSAAGLHHVVVLWPFAAWKHPVPARAAYPVSRVRAAVHSGISIRQPEAGSAARKQAPSAVLVRCGPPDRARHCPQRRAGPGPASPNRPARVRAALRLLLPTPKRRPERAAPPWGRSGL